MGKIVFVLIECPAESQPGITGGNISNTILLYQLSENHQVKLIVPNMSHAQVELFASKGIEVKTKIFSRSMAHRMKKFFWMVRRVRAEDVRDNTIVTSNGTNFCVVRRAKRKIICRAFEDFQPYTSRNGYASLLKRAAKIIEQRWVKKSYERADSIITNSNFMKSYLLNMLPNKEVQILYPPIDLDLLPYRCMDGRLKRVGIINPSAPKGEKVLLGLADIYPSIDFIYFAKQDKGYNKKNIIYGGWYSARERIFSCVDLFIVPSEWDEPFGRVSPEAIFCGIPVLTSNRGGLPETVAPEFVVNGVKPNDWSKKIEWVVNNPECVHNSWKKSLNIAIQFSLRNHKKTAARIFKC